MSCAGADAAAGSGARKLRVLVAGRTQRAEFRPAVCTLEAHAEVTCAALSATRLSASGQRRDEFDLIILLQSYAGEFLPSQVNKLASENPLAPVICILGSYSQGETRSGFPLAATHRLPWHLAAARLQAGFAGWQRGHRSWWCWPTTVADVERVQLDCPPNTNTAGVWGTVGIFAATRPAAAPLGELLTTLGVPAVVIDGAVDRPLPKLAAAIWDGAAVNRFRPPPLSQVVALVHPAPVVALVTFPRAADLQLARECGAVSVMPKLHTATDLVQQLQWLMHQRPAALLKPQSLAG